MQNRRKFLKTGVSLVAGTLLLSSCRNFSSEDYQQKNKTLNIAFFGLGGMGIADLEALLHVKNVRPVVLCDPDKRRIALAKKIVASLGFPEAEEFTDYRKVFSLTKERIDAAVVATPDHSHFAVAMEAVLHGKHIFVEKPICRTVDQLRRLAEASKKAGIITQAGNQGAASQHIRSAKEWIEAGVIGEVKEIHAWTNRPVWPQGMKFPAVKDVCPPALDWNIWLGASRERAYSKAIAPFFWRGWTDYGTGALGDMAQHILNPAFFIFDLGAPESIDAEVFGSSEYAFPLSSKITYNFPAKNSRGPIKIIWFDGDRHPPRPAGLPKDVAFPQGIGGSVIYGTKNTMIIGSSGESMSVLKDYDLIRSNPPPKKYERIRGNIYRNWVESIAAGTRPVSDFAYSIPLTEIVLLGVIAQRLGRRLEWDANSGTFKNDPEANELLKAASPRSGFIA